MRVALALCVVVGCALCGSAMAMGQRRRVRLLEALLRGVKLLRFHMLRMSEPVRQALISSGCAALEAAGRAMGPGIGAAEAWARVRREAARKGGGLDALTPEDLRALDALFERLGESGRESQEIQLDAACAALERSLEAARRRSAESDRLYLSLGTLTGLMIALILI